MREEYEYQDSDEFEDSAYDMEEDELESDELTEDEFEDQKDDEDGELDDHASDFIVRGGVTTRSSVKERGRETSVGRKKLLLKIVNDVFNTIDVYKSKAIYVGDEFAAFKSEVEREFYQALYHEDPETPEDFVHLRRENADEIRREESKAVSPDLSDEGVDFEFGRIVRELFYHAGGTLIGRVAFDPYATSFEMGTAQNGSSESTEKLLSSRGAGSERVRSESYTSNYGARPSTSASANNYTGLGAYRMARRQAQEATNERKSADDSSEKKMDGSERWLYYFRSLVAILSGFIPGATVDRSSFKSFLRLALLRLCPESVADKSTTESSIKDYFAKTLDLESPLAKKNAAQAQLIERCVESLHADPETEGFGIASLSTFFVDFHKRAYLKPLPVEEVFWIAITALTSFGRHFCSFTALESDADWRFDGEYLKGVERLLQARFAKRFFNGDMSDFVDFEKAFAELMGRGARLSQERLRDFFLQAGGLFTPTEEDEKEFREERWDGTRGDLVKKIVSEYFPQGLDVDSDEELEEFRKIGRRFGVAFFEEPNEKLRSIIVPRCILRDHVVYYVPDKFKKRIKELVEAYFRIGAKTLYFDAFYTGNERLLADANIPDAEILCYFLVGCFPKRFFTPFYMELEENDELEVLKIRNEIQRVLSVDENITLDELCARVFVSRDRLATVLELDTDEFRQLDGAYERIDSAEIPSDWKRINEEFLARLNLDARDQVSVVGKRFFDADWDEALESSNSDDFATKASQSESPKTSAKKSSAKTSNVGKSSPSDDPWAQKQTMLWNDEGSAYDFNVDSSDDASGSVEETSLEEESAEEETVHFTKQTPSSSSKRVKTSSAKRLDDASSKREKKESSTKKSSARAADVKEERDDLRATKKSLRIAYRDLIDVDDLEPKERQKAIASALAQFTEGFDLDDRAAVGDFLNVLADLGYAFDAGDSKILAEIRRVGFVVDRRVYVVRKKNGQELQDLVNEWFDGGGEIIYYSAFFARNEEWLCDRGFPTEAVLVNRLRRYYDDGAFYDEFFEREPNGELSEEEKVRQEIERVWDGSSSKRVRDLAQQLYIPADKLTEVMEMFSDEFSLLSNGYWKRIQRGVAGRKRSSQIKRKMARKRNG